MCYLAVACYLLLPPIYVICYLAVFSPHYTLLPPFTCHLFPLCYLPHDVTSPNMLLAIICYHSLNSTKP